MCHRLPVHLSVYTISYIKVHSDGDGSTQPWLNADSTTLHQRCCISSPFAQISSTLVIIVIHQVHSTWGQAYIYCEVYALFSLGYCTRILSLIICINVIKMCVCVCFCVFRRWPIPGLLLSQPYTLLGRLIRPSSPSQTRLVCGFSVPFQTLLIHQSKSLLYFHSKP